MPTLPHDSDPDRTSAVGRRAALVGLGLTGVMASAAALAPSANAATPGQMLAVTLADLRGTITPSTDIAYYVVDPGHEGMFRYDPADTTSPDDLGLVLVSSGGHRFKRSFQGPIRLSWFGARADYDPVAGTGTTADNALTAAIAALARFARNLAATGGYRTALPGIEFDAGNYLLTKKKFTPTWYTAVLGLRFVGAGMYQTNVYFNCPEATNGVDNFLFHNDNRVRGWRIDGISFFGVSDTERFLYYAGTGTASTTYFRDCSWHSFKVGFDIQGTANTSENRFQNCHIKTWSPGSVFYNSNNAQSVNNSFIDCEFEVFKGIALKFTKGGNLNVIGGSIIPFDAGTFLHIEDAGGAGVGSQNCTFNLIGVKPETRDTSTFLYCNAPSAKVSVTDCLLVVGHATSAPVWSSGVSYGVGQRSVVDGRAFSCTTAHTSSASDQPLTGPNWATVWQPLYEITMLNGGALSLRGGSFGYTAKLVYNNSSWASNGATRPSLTFDGTGLRRTVTKLADLVPSGVISNSGSLPRVRANGCRSEGDTVPVDVSLNAVQGFDRTAHTVKCIIHRHSAATPYGLPAASDGQQTFLVPNGAVILKAGVVALQSGVTGSFTVTNHDGTVDLVSGLGGDIEHWYAVTDELERQVRVTSTASTRSKGFVYVQYI